MIQKRFAEILDELEGLIKVDALSAPRGIIGLVALSGGVDSMCLADLFLKTVGVDGFAVAHCNFNLRGEESDGDEAMVREWTQARGVKSHFKSFDTNGFARDKGVSIEMAARELRYRWFAELCTRHGYDYVAVAHHADDNAETLILNLTRGTGLKGAVGMKRVSTLPYSSDDIGLMRPLLNFTRKQIEGYAYASGLPYRVDSTNSSVDYKRNRIRHEVFPVLEKLNPSYVRTLNRNMAYFSDAEEIVSEWCRAEAEKVVTYDENGTADIFIDRLMSCRQWRYLLYHILEPMGFNSSVLASIEDLLVSGRTISGKEFKADSFAVITGRDRLSVVPVSILEGDDDVSVFVDGPGQYSLGDTGFVVELCPWTSDMPKKQPEGVLAFDASVLKFPLVFRKWRRGDWMVPFGMKGKKKVSDIFADLKFDALGKARAIVIVEDGEVKENQRVAGLLGLRMDESFRITENTQMIVKIKQVID